MYQILIHNISLMYCFNHEVVCFIGTSKMCTDPERPLESQVTANSFSNIKLKYLRESKQTFQVIMSHIQTKLIMKSLVTGMSTTSL